MSLPTDAKARKGMPICTGVLDYFPDAIAYVAHVSKVGNDQHNPGQPMHWAKEKSTDHADCVARHLVERGKTDVDGIMHSGKLAWRALALLQTELEAAQAAREAPQPFVPKPASDRLEYRWIAEEVGGVASPGEPTSKPTERSEPFDVA